MHNTPLNVQMHGKRMRRLWTRGHRGPPEQHTDGMTQQQQHAAADASAGLQQRQEQEEQRELLAWLSSSSAASSSSSSAPGWDPGELARALPLSALQAKASALHRHQDAVLRAGRQQESSAAATLAHAQSALRAYALAVERHGCFSSNEEADDLLTSQLKHLMAPFYLAELLASSPASASPGQPPGSEPGASGRERAHLVADAVRHYSAFLQRLEQYALLDDVANQQLQAADSAGDRDDTHEPDDGDAASGTSGARLQPVSACTQHHRHADAAKLGERLPGTSRCLGPRSGAGARGPCGQARRQD